MCTNLHKQGCLLISEIHNLNIKNGNHFLMPNKLGLNVFNKLP